MSLVRIWEGHGCSAVASVSNDYHSVRCSQVANLADVQLFTSIPPRISRADGAGREIGQAYQADCIESWIDAGFDPVTINARSERVEPESRLQRVTLERDASEITGKPHPYFGDLLSAVAERTKGPFALVNADILIPSSAALDVKVASIRPGEMIIGRRLDVAQLGASGTPYLYGYDFFAAHGEDVAALTETHLIFGAPWWDHFFPLAMHLQGVQITQLEPQIIHLQHDERWDFPTYRKLGDRFIAEIGPRAGVGGYARRLQRILGSDPSARRAAMKRATRPYRRRALDPERECQLILNRVGNLNVAVIDLVAPAASGVRKPLKLRIQATLLRLGGARHIFSAATDNSSKP